jgi:hypothetical protein
MNLTSVLSSLGSLAGSIATSIIPGAGAIEDLVKAGKAVSDAYSNVKVLNGGTAPADADASHAALMEKMNAHANGTLGRLEGGD